MAKDLRRLRLKRDVKKLVGKHCKEIVRRYGKKLVETECKTLMRKYGKKLLDKYYEKLIKKHGIHLTVVVNSAAPDVVQNSIHNPANPFSIAHKQSSAAASLSELATAASGNNSPAQATDDGAVSAFGSAAADNTAQAAVDRSENEGGATPAA